MLLPSSRTQLVRLIPSLRPLRAIDRIAPSSKGRASLTVLAGPSYPADPLSRGLVTVTPWAEIPLNKISLARSLMAH